MEVLKLAKVRSSAIGRSFGCKQCKHQSCRHFFSTSTPAIEAHRTASKRHRHSLLLPPISPPPTSNPLKSTFKMASFARLALSTGRVAFRPATNPVQCALGGKGSSQFLTASRSYATAFERNKPHVNIGE